MKLNDKLQDPALKGKVIYFYCGQHPHRRANAAFLIAAWAMMYLGQARALARGAALVGGMGGSWESSLD